MNLLLADACLANAPSGQESPLWSLTWQWKMIKSLARHLTITMTDCDWRIQFIERHLIDFDQKQSSFDLADSHQTLKKFFSLNF